MEITITLQQLIACCVTVAMVIAALALLAETQRERAVWAEMKLKAMLEAMKELRRLKGHTEMQ